MPLEMGVPHPRTGVCWGSTGTCRWGANLGQAQRIHSAGTGLVTVRTKRSVQEGLIALEKLLVQIGGDRSGSSVVRPIVPKQR